MASYASKQSTAIDYQRFSAPRSAEKPEVQPQIEVLPEGKSARKPSRARVPYGKYVVLSTCIFAVLAVIVFSYMSLAELTTQNDRLKSQISTLKAQESSLNAKKEQMYNLAFVEDYAKNVLGMVKLDKSEIEYVELSNPERMTVGTDSGGESEGVSGLIRSFSAVLEYIR